MNEKAQSIDNLVSSLQERAKELNCLYQVEELCSKPDINLEETYKGIINAIPPGWQFSDVCQAKINIGDYEYKVVDFKETDWVQVANIQTPDEMFGSISVYYTEERPTADEGPFLKEERKLINTIAERLGRCIYRSIYRPATLKEDARRTWWWQLHGLQSPWSILQRSLIPAVLKLEP